MSAKISLNQHYRLSIERAKLDYRDGLITAAGLLFYTIGVLRKPGQHVAMQVKDWLQLTGLSERTFYKAKAKLIGLGRLEERITGTIELWIGSNVIELGDCPNVQEQKTEDCPKVPKDCPKVPEDCPKVPEDCPIVPTDCPIVPTDCPIVPTDCPNGQVHSPIGQYQRPIGQNESLKTNQRKGLKLSSINTIITNKPILSNEGEVLKSDEPAKTKTQELPTDLKGKLEELGILKGTKRDGEVLETINRYHISQAYAAANHVERSFESIDNPSAVFLYQLPRQPKEALGPRDLKTAVDLAPKMTPDYLKGLYGVGWKAAAAHFGIEIKED